ncbi:MAG TPA: MraY family glycosyltransferase [Candidatus Acidoferrales bacterium]|nr:MraY family glycosyltransferase [Candidatus Acidoferrales bacterium]
MFSYYAIVFLGTVFTSLVFTRIVRDRAVHRGWLDRGNAGRHFHVNPVPRLGGVAIFLTFILATGLALITTRMTGAGPVVPIRGVLGIILPAFLILILGLYDDWFTLGPYWKFGVQAIAASWLYIGGYGIYRLDLYSNHALLRITIGLPLTIFWVLLITNAFNLIDGLDGLSAGSALFATAIMFSVSVGTHVTLVPLFAIVLAGTIFGFLRYNFHPASIFLGDSGSLFIGFLLSALAMAGFEKATTAVAVAIPVVSFGLPLLDVSISLIRRFLNDKPIFRGDDDHVHHKLLKRGFSHRNAVLVLYAVAAAFGLLSLMLLHGKVMIGFDLVVIGLGVWWGIQELKYVELYEILAIGRRIWRQKQFTANNLLVRRAIESLSGASPDIPEICRILRATLDSTGFCGAAFDIPQIEGMDEALLFPLKCFSESKLFYFWAELDDLTPKWELRFDLVSSSGNPLGEMSLLRARASELLFVDVNLLDTDFRAAISKALERALFGARGRRQPQVDPGRALPARATFVGSHSD